MKMMDVDAGSLKDWLAQVDYAGSARSGGHCPLALFLDEIEGGEHIVSRDRDGLPIAGLGNFSEPTARLQPGEYKQLPPWARRFTEEADALKKEQRGEVVISGPRARDILEGVLQIEGV